MSFTAQLPSRPGQTPRPHLVKTMVASDLVLGLRPDRFGPRASLIGPGVIQNSEIRCSSGMNLGSDDCALAVLLIGDLHQSGVPVCNMFFWRRHKA